jgi:hypothetical protein
MKVNILTDDEINIAFLGEDWIKYLNSQKKIKKRKISIGIFLFFIIISKFEI